MLAAVRRVLHRDHGARTDDHEMYPFCVGLVRFEDQLIRDALVDTSPHALGNHSTFTLLRHDEGPNMRRPLIEREAWTMLLAFPMDYQTEYHLIKEVSCFGRITYWHRPGHCNAHVIVRVLINEVALVPFSLVVKSLQISPGLESRGLSLSTFSMEEIPTQTWLGMKMRFLLEAAIQQAQHDAQVWQMQNTANAWEAAPAPPPPRQGWGEWHVLPPVPEPYRGFSYRQMTGYEGPSMMDGIQTSGAE